MKILYLTSRIPYPPFRGDRLHGWNVIRELSRRHDITLISFIENNAERRWVPELKRYCARVEVLRLPRLVSLWNCLRALPGSEPLQVAYFRSPAMRRLVEAIEDEVRPDVFHVHLFRMAQYARPRRTSPRVIDLRDAISLYLDRFVRRERNPVKKLLVATELKRILNYEPVVGEFEGAVISTDLDRTTMLSHVPQADIKVMHNGVDINHFAPLPDVVPDPHRIVFTGNMTYFPNADAARYLVSDIMPLITRRIPEARLFLVGQNPPRSIRALASGTVVVTGFVDDIRAEYARSAVAVAPVRYGAGTLNKLLEPMAMGVPVVTTPVGAGGLDLDAGREFFVAEHPQAFADSVVAMMTDPELRARVGTAAMEKIRATHSWQASVRVLEDVYASVAMSPSVVVPSADTK